MFMKMTSNYFKISCSKCKKTHLIMKVIKRKSQKLITILNAFWFAKSIKSTLIWNKITSKTINEVHVIQITFIWRLQWFHLKDKNVPAMLTFLTAFALKHVWVQALNVLHWILFCSCICQYTRYFYSITYMRLRVYIVFLFQCKGYCGCLKGVFFLMIFLITADLISKECDVDNEKLACK